MRSTSGDDSGVAGPDMTGRGEGQHVVQLFDFGFIFFAVIGIADENMRSIERFFVNSSSVEVRTRIYWTARAC